MTDDTLLARCGEILHWHRTGMLQGHAIRDLATQLRAKHGDVFSQSEAIAHAEKQTSKEAMAFVISHQIKPLEWTSRTDGIHMNGQTNRQIVHEARTPIGYYAVERDAPGKWFVMGGFIGATCIDQFDLEADALAAAQRHHEQRIRECFE